VRVLADDVSDAAEGEGLGQVKLHRTCSVGEHRAGGAHGRGRHGAGVGILVVVAGDASAVHQLQHDATLRGVHGVGDPAPGRDLLGAEDARGARVTLAVATRLRALRDNEPGARARRVVAHCKFAWDVARQRTVARHRRHHDPVRKLQAAEVDRP
jgi:hypothetical protein